MSNANLPVKNYEEKQPPSVVAHVFVEKYYTILEQNIEFLYKFYHQDASCTRRDEENSEQTHSGNENIREALIAHETAGGRVALSSVDYQTSIDGGVIVSVIGSIWTKQKRLQMSENEDDADIDDDDAANQIERRFVQTFFLVPEVPERPNLYYVRNDMFAFLESRSRDNEEFEDTEAIEEKQLTEIPTSGSIKSDDDHLVSSSLPENSPEPERDLSPEPQDEESEENQENLNLPQTTYPQTPSPPPEKEEAVQLSPPPVKPKTAKSAAPPKSSAQISSAVSMPSKAPVTSAKDKPRPVPPTAAPKKTWAGVVALVANENQEAPVPVVTSAVPSKPKTKAPEKQLTKPVPSKNQERSVELLINNIPYNSTTENITETFSIHGPIKLISRDGGKCFIECDNQISTSILNAQPWYLDGRELKIRVSSKKGPQGGGNQNRSRNPANRQWNDYPRDAGPNRTRSNRNQSFQDH